MTQITYYHILGVSSDAPADEIVAAFRKKVKQWHPDVSRHPEAEERMREINEAAEILCDPERRARYDRALAGAIPFECIRYGRQRSGGEGFWHRVSTQAKTGLSAVRSVFFSGSASVRYIATGTFAFLILVTMMLAAITAIPLLVEPLNTLDGNIAGIPSAEVMPGGDLTGIQEAGDERLSDGDYEKALALYNAMIEHDPQISRRDFWYNRGIALSALGLYPEATDSFDRVLRIAPGDSPALAQKGAALIGLGRYEESLQYTDKALAANSDAAWIWNNRGIALAGIGQQKEARAAFENAGVISGQTENSLYRQVVAKTRPDLGY